MDESYIAKLREIHTENVEGTEGSWVPWNVAAEKEGGEDLLKEMVEAGTVLARRNKKLPATTKIPWPQNQEVQHIVETFSRKKRRVESECKEDGAGEVDTFNESFHAQAAHVNTAHVNSAYDLKAHVRKEPRRLLGLNTVSFVCLGQV